MKLKRLDIHGFKSFYHRTTVAFDDGITAVVGPNGCGKSNVVDAIKWVMGEQGARNLRGKAMEDVVFAGSEQRGPMGMCEVRLTFVNDGTAEVPTRWRDVDELAVERRLERNRGSEYRLNKQRCRLSDVQELVAGTGVGSGPGGRRAYAIIEQGQIGRIVSAKADERRLLIEEAAGVTRYRTRKKQAQRKMDEVALNLERIDDIIGEVEVRLRSLSRQAKKAERYQAYHGEAAGIAQRVLAADLRAHTATFESQRLHTEALADQDARAVEAGDTLETHTSATLDAVALASARTQACAADLAASERAEALAHTQIEAFERAQHALLTQAGALHEEQAAGAGRAASLLAENDRLSAQIAEAEVQISADEAHLKVLEAARATAHRALLDTRAAAEGLRRAEAQEIHALAQACAQAEASQHRVEDLHTRAQQAQAESDALAQRQPDAVHALEGARATLAGADARLNQARVHRQAQSQAHQAHRDQAEAARKHERAVTEALATVRGRLGSLEEIDARHEDLGDAGRALLAANVPGVIGPVADALVVPAELEQAVAAALGRRLQAVLVTDRAAAARALATLRDAGAGRALLALADAQPPPVPAMPSRKGIRGPLVDALDAPSTLVRALLGLSVLADDLPSALAASAHWPGPVVTPTGERVEAGTYLFAGGAGADSSPLRRRRQIKDLRERSVLGVQAQAAAHDQVESANAALAAAADSLEAASQAGHAAELTVLEARKDQARLEASAHELERGLQRHQRAATQLRASEDAARAKATTAAMARAALETGRTDRARSIEAASAHALEAEHTRDATVGALHEARTRCVARRERVDALEGTQSRVRRMQSDLEARAQRTASNHAQLSAQGATLEAQHSAAQNDVQRHQHAVEQRTGALTDARAHERAVTTAAQTARETLSGARRARDAARERLNAARLSLQEARLALDHLTEQIHSRLHCTPEHLLADPAAAQAPTDDDRQRLSALEALIERMDSVNLGAIDEYDEVAQRHAFLEGQKADLGEAMGDLQAAIEQIDQTSQGLFAETFAAVNVAFEAIFPRLFQGGRGALVLTEPDDLARTGIEMLVRPPGKTVQNVALLSGGEKALCAIALVFAVFRVKPSPFCLLDEVDAPLDDANIGRFNEIVREMAQTSQIVLITHNKRTMEIADVLYGITMEASGISKLVSVRMN
jgi:chromosome segregation protein